MATKRPKPPGHPRSSQGPHRKATTSAPSGSRSTRAAATKLDSRDALIEAAKQLFAESSFDGTTVKDIAERANVNISLVSYYFQGKEGLYRTCLETFGHLQLSSAERVLKSPDSVEDFRLRLRVFAEEFVALHLREPNICKILHRDCDAKNPIVMDIFRTSFMPLYFKFRSYFEQAVQSGFLEEDLDVDTATMFVFGGMIQIIKMDETRKTLLGKSLFEEKGLDTVVDEIVRTCTSGMLRRTL